MESLRVVYTGRRVRNGDIIREKLKDDRYELFVLDEMTQCPVLGRANIWVLESELGKFDIEVLKMCKERYPEVKKLVIGSSYQIGFIVDMFNAGLMDKFIGKPCRLDTEVKPLIMKMIEEIEGSQN